MLERLKQLLWITDTTQDDILNAYIVLAESVIEEKLWYKMAVEEIEEKIDADDCSIFFLKAPIKQINSIVWWEYKKHSKNALYLKSKVSGEITINYDWWIAEEDEHETLIFPEVIAFAIVDLAKWAYESESLWTSNIKQKKIDTLSITYFSPAEKSELNSIANALNIDSLIAPYKLLFAQAI